MSESSIVYISIGSNIEPEKNLQTAINMLRERFEIMTISSVYQSPPFGYTEQPDFLDIVVKMKVAESPESVKTTLTAVEKRLGRNRASQENKYGPLTLDMDILLWDEKSFDYGDKPWRVPDKGVTQYGAVAIPLAEIAADVLHPEEDIAIGEIAARFDKTSSIRRADLKIE
jgi:2-amino-4-hydroxy-6-hydroxymethyldihydropteridine diphosphokinase